MPSQRYDAIASLHELTVTRYDTGTRNQACRLIVFKSFTLVSPWFHNHQPPTTNPRSRSRSLRFAMLIDNNATGFGMNLSIVRILDDVIRARAFNFSRFWRLNYR
jgi:hypothetical protein